MKLYSIGELSVLSQIKSHTIRIWEQRYKLLTPTRSEGNTRYYSDDQLMKLMKVALLNKSGVKISQIAKLSEEDLIEKTNQLALSDSSIDLGVEQFMVASLNFDQHKIVYLFDKYIFKYGIEKTYEEIIFPFLRVVGNLWVNGKITPAHEHFFTNLCKLKLFSVIDQLPMPEPGKTPVILGLPEWDFHELGILYYAYLFRKAGYNSTYLGQAVPTADIVKAAETVNARYAIITFIGPTTQESVQDYLDRIIKASNNLDILISGPHTDFKINDRGGRISKFRNMNDLVDKFGLRRGEADSKTSNSGIN